jgi:hypothetical protein
MTIRRFFVVTIALTAAGCGSRDADRAKPQEVAIAQQARDSAPTTPAPRPADTMAVHRAEVFVHTVQFQFDLCSRTAQLGAIEASNAMEGGATASDGAKIVSRRMRCQDSVKAILSTQYAPARDGLTSEQAKSAMKDFYAFALSALPELWPRSGETIGLAANQRLERRLDALKSELTLRANRVRAEF